MQVRKTEEETPRLIATCVELFDVILEAHVSTGDGGEKKKGKKNKEILDGEYSNIAGKMVSYFVSNCNTCQRKKSKPNKGLVVKPIRSKSYYDKRPGGPHQNGICSRRWLCSNS